jgi:4-amino-4-deoxy-L-arabinose transferase-like glycosyltransferase
VQAPSPPDRRTWVLLGLFCLAAIVLRTAYALHVGASDFWNRGYFYYDIARNIAAGKGILRIEGIYTEWAIRPPLYPIFLSLAALAGGNYLLIVIPQALIGAGTVLCAFLIGCQLFGTRAGMIAAALTAIYPYYVVHDTSLQETGLQTFFAALSVYLLLLAQARRSMRLWLATGLMLGLTVLVRGMMLPFALCALAWVGVLGKGLTREKLQRVLLIFLAFAVVVGAWLVRNELVVGRPVLSSESGQLFWLAHNTETFSRYPRESIDRSSDRAVASLSKADNAQLASLDEVGRSDWYQSRGWAYVLQHPGQTVVEGFRKVAIAFSWTFSPAARTAKQLVYFVSYAPILILGLLGMVLTRQGWRRHSIIYLQFLTFSAVTAVYFAITNHRTYLDVYLIVFMAALIDHVWTMSRSANRAT